MPKALSAFTAASLCNFAYNRPVCLRLRFSIAAISITAIIFLSWKPSSTGEAIRPIEQIKRPCPYECCIDMPGYEYKYCPSGLACCDHLCKESCKPSGFNISKSLIFWVLLASILPIVAFLIFIWKKNAFKFFFDVAHFISGFLLSAPMPEHGASKRIRSNNFNPLMSKFFSRLQVSEI